MGNKILGNDKIYSLNAFFQPYEPIVYKITPTVSVFEGEEIVLMHICVRQGQERSDFDVWPDRKATFQDILNLPSSIKDINFIYPYCKIGEGHDTHFQQLAPIWLSYKSDNGGDVSLSGEKIEYDTERIYQVKLVSLPFCLMPDYRYLFFDTETTGLPHKVSLDSTGRADWPRLVQLSWILTNGVGSIIGEKTFIIKPEGFQIPSSSVSVHGISTYRAVQEGKSLSVVLDDFYHDYSIANVIVGHNVDFDIGVLDSEFENKGRSIKLEEKETVCTMKVSRDYCKIKSKWGYGYDYPSLQELYNKLFGRDYQDAHNAYSDVKATMYCYWEMRKRNLIDFTNRPVDDLTTPLVNYISVDLPF